MLGRPTFAGGGRCVLVPVRAATSLVALDSASGAVLWRSGLPGGGVSGQAVLNCRETAVFAGGGDSHVWGLALGGHACAAGPPPRPLWNVSLGGRVDASLAVSSDGRLVFAATDENKATLAHGP
jgi:outer membrane protein assembly factor BamB